MMKNDSETQCCPRFNPVPCQDKEIEWEDKLFVRDTMMQFMHTPLPGAFGKTVARMWRTTEDAGATPDTRDFIMLATESSPWKGEAYINVTEEVPNAENVKLSGTYVA